MKKNIKQPPPYFIKHSKFHGVMTSPLSVHPLFHPLKYYENNGWYVMNDLQSYTHFCELQISDHDGKILKIVITTNSEIHEFFGFIFRYLLTEEFKNLFLKEAK